MPFDVGDRVVYPHHGAALIVRKETRDFKGEETEYLVLEVKRDETVLTLSVPRCECRRCGHASADQPG